MIRQKGYGPMIINWGELSEVCPDFSRPLCIIFLSYGIGEDTRHMRSLKRKGQTDLCTSKLKIFSMPGCHILEYLV